MAIRRLLLQVVLVALLASVLSIPSMAQEDPRPRKNTLVIGGGAGIPGADLGNVMSPSALLRLGYGYRLRKHFQVDIGADLVLHAAGIDVSQQTFIGEVRKRDNEYLIPFGGRVVLPLAQRFEVFAGGGGTYLWYGEEAYVPGMKCTGSCYYDVPCPSCISRGGWGYYGTAGVHISLERRNRFWLGTEMRYFKGATSGRLLGNGAQLETKDQWFNPSLNLVCRF